MTEPFENPRCPTCDGSGIPILFGYPSKAVIEAAETGEAALGGCVVDDEMPAWQCRTDPEHRWGSRRFR